MLHPLETKIACCTVFEVFPTLIIPFSNITWNEFDNNGGVSCFTFVIAPCGQTVRNRDIIFFNLHTHNQHIHILTEGEDRASKFISWTCVKIGTVWWPRAAIRIFGVFSTFSFYIIFHFVPFILFYFVFKNNLL